MNLENRIEGSSCTITTMVMGDVVPEGLGHFLNGHLPSYQIQSEIYLFSRPFSNTLLKWAKYFSLFITRHFHLLTCAGTWCGMRSNFARVGNSSNSSGLR